MKAKLIFDLSDIDDRKEHLRCVKASDMASILWEFSTNSKKQIEWEAESKKLSGHETLELIFNKFYELMDDGGVRINELYE
jgi:hypothetical protein